MSKIDWNSVEEAVIEQRQYPASTEYFDLAFTYLCLQAKWWKFIDSIQRERFDQMPSATVELLYWVCNLSIIMEIPLQSVLRTDNFNDVIFVEHDGKQHCVASLYLDHSDNITQDMPLYMLQVSAHVINEYITDGDYEKEMGEMLRRMVFYVDRLAGMYGITIDKAASAIVDSYQRNKAKEIGQGEENLIPEKTETSEENDDSGEVMDITPTMTEQEFLAELNYIEDEDDLKSLKRLLLLKQRFEWVKHVDEKLNR